MTSIGEDVEKRKQRVSVRIDETITAFFTGYAAAAKSLQ